MPMKSCIVLVHFVKNSSVCSERLGLKQLWELHERLTLFYAKRREHIAFSSLPWLWLYQIWEVCRMFLLVSFLSCYCHTRTTCKTCFFLEDNSLSATWIEMIYHNRYFWIVLLNLHLIIILVIYYILFSVICINCRNLVVCRYLMVLSDELSFSYSLSLFLVVVYTPGARNCQVISHL